MQKRNSILEYNIIKNSSENSSIQTQEQQQLNFKLFPFATNKNGTKIFCRFTINKKTLLKGFYDFNKELFYITHYNKNNLIQLKMGKKFINNKLKQILLIDYDWKL